MNAENMKGKKILVIGFGKSGIAAAQAMSNLGAIVSVQDSKTKDQFDPSLMSVFQDAGVKFYLGETPQDFSQFDMIILSPGVSPELPFIQEAQAQGVEITGELEIAYRIGSGNYVAITGTNGKTTTTTLVGEIFRRAGKPTHVVGNIGVAVITESVHSKEEDWLITECSSFQLETTRYFKPVISAILNLTPDHLNRHHTMEAYGAAKAKVFANQTSDGYLVINSDDKVCYALADGCRAKVVPFSMEQEHTPGAFVKDGRIVVRDEDGRDHDILGRDEIRIIGDHNVMNVLAAAAISFFAGIEPRVIGDAIREFNGVAHRIEYCGEIDGVRYYNDSKGTNTDAAITAIHALKKNIILIAGGDAKGQSFDGFLKEFPGRVKKMILLGRDAKMIQEAADRAGFRDYCFEKDMNDCVKKAYELAEPGDVVLLSPACASWDMYDNFEQRGDHFKMCVEELAR
ncbi:MAG: UDP-N-acetylmuramoyl-L-alanine--D-glutamate ligase [Anaerovoracaceae bacterium]|jgi:UDP-N-acetylmuramoylalanine--D-glutamate ligase